MFIMSSNLTQLDEELVEHNSRTSAKYAVLMDQLKGLVLLTRDNNTLRISENHFNQLLKIIRVSPCFHILAECYRILRNCTSQSCLIPGDKNIQLMEESIKHVNKLMLKELSEDEIILNRVIFQYICNTLNSNSSCTTIVWKGLQSCFRDHILHKDEKICLYSSAVLYAVLRNSPTTMKEITYDTQWRNLVTALIVSSHQGVMFSYNQLSIQLYLNNECFKKLYLMQGLDEKLLLLYQISEFIQDCQLHIENLLYFSFLFQEKANLVLRTFDSPIMDLEALEVSGLLEILAKSSSFEVFHNKLLHDNNLLIYILKNIHTLGQSGSNYFSRIEDHFQTVDSHPGLNFKCNLVRLLGNLCHQNPEAQNQVNRLEGITPLLECCNLDARNPFIQQWAVLAIRNICKNNPKNQEVIRSLTRQGVVQTSTLQELGLEVQESSEGFQIRRFNS